MSIFSKLFGKKEQPAEKIDHYALGEKAISEGLIGPGMEEYRKAVEEGDGKAACQLGFMNAYGFHVDRNISEAIRWYMKAAELGNGDGACQMAQFYLSGYGVDQDYDKAREWAEKGKALGSDKAQDLLERISYEN